MAAPFSAPSGPKNLRRPWASPTTTCFPLGLQHAAVKGPSSRATSAPLSISRSESEAAWRMRMSVGSADGFGCRERMGLGRGGNSRSGWVWNRDGSQPLRRLGQKRA